LEYFGKDAVDFKRILKIKDVRNQPIFGMRNASNFLKKMSKKV
jgi:hypothetical protein